jgi:cytidylate kinase
LKASQHPVHFAPFEPRPFVTLSRETCAGATTVGQLLAKELDVTLGLGDWLFMDKNLITAALTQHHRPAGIAAHLSEVRQSEITAIVGELIGLHPPLWDLEQEVLESMLQWATIGRVILVGWGSGFVTHKMPGGFHVRLVAPLETRVKRMAAMLGCDETSALAKIREADRGRHRYLKTRFSMDSEDAHLYDMVINTGRVSAETVAKTIALAMAQRRETARQTPTAIPA